MVFSSSLFLLYFLPIFLIIYSLIRTDYKNYIVLLASILFYAWGAPQFLFILLGSTIIDFYLVKKLAATTDESTRKALLITSITLNLGLLLFFKYANFFVDNVNSALLSAGVETIEWTYVVLPIGISFYTFQTLTYSIDVYRKQYEPLNRVTDYLLYIMSFPQMIAGPIVRFSTIRHQITERVETSHDKLMGFYRFSIGLGKKVLIANVMGQQADLIMDGNISSLSSGEAWVGILAYSMQIYFDFSGYSDMAIGLGRMIGFSFPENFNSPYTATSISDFWRKWHITLGDFMREYLYIPLGGSRVESKSRLYFNLWLVFLLSGLWHGASWNFVVWGAYHGLFLILDRLFLRSLLSKSGQVVSTLVTLFIVVIGWVFFRLDTLSDAFNYIGQLFSFNQVSFDAPIVPMFFIMGMLAIVFSFINAFKIGKMMENYLFFKDDYSVVAYSLNTIVSILLFLICVSSVTSSGFNPFIYFRF